MPDDENNSSAYLEKNPNISSVSVLDVESHAGVNDADGLRQVFEVVLGYRVPIVFLSSFP